MSGKQEVPIKNLQLKQVMVQLKCPTKSRKSDVIFEIGGRGLDYIMLLA